MRVSKAKSRKGETINSTNPYRKEQIMDKISRTDAVLHQTGLTLGSLKGLLSNDSDFPRPLRRMKRRREFSENAIDEWVRSRPVAFCDLLD